MLSGSMCQTLANDLRSLLNHKDITVAGVAQVWVPTLDRAAEYFVECKPETAEHTLSGVAPTTEQSTKKGACGCGSTKYGANHLPQDHAGWQPD